MSEQESRMSRWLLRLARLPRLGRIILIGVIAILFGLFVLQVATLLAGDMALYDMATAQNMFLISGAAGLAAYVVGWVCLVGFEREAQPQLKRRAVYYVLFGLLVAVALGIWLLVSVAIAMLPPQIPL